MNLPEYRLETRRQLETVLPRNSAELAERSCFDAAIAANVAAGESLLLNSQEFMSRYDSITMRVCMHLLHTSVHVEGLLSDILAGRLDPRKLGEMTPEMLNPEASRAVREDINIRMAQKIKLKTSTAYRCRKCGNNCTTYEEYQGRSGDEQSCISHKCMMCGHTWRT